MKGVRFFRSFRHLVHVSARKPYARTRKRRVSRYQGQYFLLHRGYPRFLRVPILVLKGYGKGRIMSLSRFLYRDLCRQRGVVKVNVSMGGRNRNFPPAIGDHLLPRFHQYVPNFRKGEVFRVSTMFRNAKFLLQRGFSSTMLPRSGVRGEFRVYPNNLLPMVSRGGRILRIPNSSGERRVSRRRYRPPRPIRFYGYANKKFFLAITKCLYTVNTKHPKRVPKVFFPTKAFRRFSRNARKGEARTSVIPGYISGSSPVTLANFRAFYRSLLGLFKDPRSVRRHRVYHNCVVCGFFQFRGMSLFLSHGVRASGDRVVLQMLLFVSFPRYLSLPRNECKGHYCHGLRGVPSPIYVSLWGLLHYVGCGVPSTGGPPLSYHVPKRTSKPSRKRVYRIVGFSRLVSLLLWRGLSLFLRYDLRLLLEGSSL